MEDLLNGGGGDRRGRKGLSINNRGRGGRGGGRVLWLKIEFAFSGGRDRGIPVGKG